MFDPSYVPYPTQDEIHADEDGVGFALRMATLNGITFNDLARQLASPGHLYLPARSASALAFMFGCTPTRLHQAFARRYFLSQRHGVHFLTHDFRRPYHLRQTRPRVCPICLHERRYATAAWSISLITACSTHGIRLIERCICGRPVTWRRPSIEFCECGASLTAPHQPLNSADSREIAISSHAMYLLGPAHYRLHPDDAMLGVFDGISIDTFLRLVWAFGVADSDGSAALRHPANRFIPAQEASELCCRAYDRLARLTAMRKNRSDVPVHRSSFEALRLDCVTGADVQLVESLADRLHTLGIANRSRTASRDHPQLSLFEEDYDR
jgi:hypothetical protein